MPEGVVKGRHYMLHAERALLQDNPVIGKSITGLLKPPVRTPTSKASNCFARLRSWSTSWGEILSCVCRARFESMRLEESQLLSCEILLIRG